MSSRLARRLSAKRPCPLLCCRFGSLRWGNNGNLWRRRSGARLHRRLAVCRGRCALAPHKRAWRFQDAKPQKTIRIAREHSTKRAILCAWLRKRRSRFTRAKHVPRARIAANPRGAASGAISFRWQHKLRNPRLLPRHQGRCDHSRHLCCEHSRQMRKR